MTSPQQRRLATVSRDCPGAYEARCSLRLDGALDAARFERSWQQVLRRHGIEAAGAPRLRRLGPLRHQAEVALPASATDGIGLRSLISELAHAYGRAAGAAGAEDGPAPSYERFARLMNERAVRADAMPGSEFWRRQYDADLLPLHHPFERQDRAAGFRPRSIAAELPREAPPALLLACWVVLLRRVVDRPALVLGVGLPGRNLPRSERAVGLFHRYLPLRCACDLERPIDGLVRQIEGDLREMARWQDRFVWPDEGGDTAPYFSFGFDWEEGRDEPVASGQLRIRTESECAYVDRLSLRLRAVRRPEGVRAEFHYDATRLGAEEVGCLADQYRTLLQSAGQQPDAATGRLNMLGAAERERVLHAFNRTRVDYPRSGSLAQRLAAQAAAVRDRTAVHAEDGTWTYGELDDRATRLAGWLRRRGLRPGELAGILLQRSPDLVLAVLAVLKAGGAWLPLDASDPLDRLRFMLDDARPRLVITRQELIDRLPPSGAEVVFLDRDREEIAREEPGGVAVQAADGDPAYVIYTSGSTGGPKGVVVPHRGILNRLLWMQDALRLGPDDRVLHKTPVTFDVSVWELLWPLLAGAGLVIARPEGHRDCTYLSRLVVRERVTVMHFVPSMLRLFLDSDALEDCRSLRLVISSGEALQAAVQERFFARLDADLYNLYGPTEASIDVTFWRCVPDAGRRTVPIGRPIANTRIHLLDDHLQPVPVGVPGELCIAGEGLASGYLGRPGLTAERFVPDPFGTDPAARLYRSGDLARYRPDGIVEFLGRIDDALKIRGVRIEPGEVEGALLAHPGVHAAAVVAQRTGDDDPSLAACVVADPEVTGGELRRLLGARLPAAMLPSRFSFVDSLPLMPNGKVDRAALSAALSAGRPAAPSPARRDPEAMPAAPAVATPAAPAALRQTVAGVWREVLGLDEVGSHDNFFDLGGHSLLLIRVHQKLQRLLEVEFPLLALFQYPTVDTLSRFLGGQAGRPAGSPPGRVEAR